MVSKFGKKFEDVSKLFDHAARHGSNYLNGHCFVSLMLCVPVWYKEKVVYLAVLSVIVCGRNRNPSWNWQLTW